MVNLDLVDQVVFDVGDQEVVAHVDELLIERIIDRISVNAILNEEDGQCVDLEGVQQSLILFVCRHRGPLEQYKVVLINLTA